VTHSTFSEYLTSLGLQGYFVMTGTTSSVTMGKIYRDKIYFFL
jgi:hypothetical protein